MARRTWRVEGILLPNTHTCHCNVNSLQTRTISSSVLCVSQWVAQCLDLAGPSKILCIDLSNYYFTEGYTSQITNVNTTYPVRCFRINFVCKTTKNWLTYSISNFEHVQDIVPSKGYKKWISIELLLCSQYWVLHTLVN